MQNQQPILHIGLHKTGTTWFQKRFYTNVENCNFIDREVVREKLLKPGVFQFNADAAALYFSRFSKKIIICEEDLTIGMRGNSLIQKELFERLKVVFPDACVIVFLRNQLEKIASAYCYYLKNNGGTFGFQRFLKYRHENPYSNFSFKPENLFYHHFLELMQQYFKKENIFVYLYEDFAADNKKFLEGFSSVHNLQVDLDRISFDRENERIRNGLILIARFSNLFTKPRIFHRTMLINLPYWTGLNRSMLKRLNKLSFFGKPPTALEIMGRKTYDYYWDFYKGSNRKLIEEFGFNDIEKFKYPL